ncbi:hypothetical protein Syun_006333 [Stephania yunnanensis]|uniref:Uncharacterized protein n=1 Tax=Stephania yunnanensis TaxID=152371 RepID=A0AAP0KY23_9MAGN
MLFDTISGLRRKTRYIPCRFFSLNSVTLTLLAVATKLPVDLTSYMPSALDQLSKLTGTTMICVYMGFIFPSLGGSRELESMSNLVALGIFVATVFVDICIQISTKVIFSFVIEHILILCFMLILLLKLWVCNTEMVRNVKDVLVERNRQLFEKGEGSLMHRVKRWYMYGCMYNPQLLFCRLIVGMAAKAICVFCSIILLLAAYRSLAQNDLEFCNGFSDYGWSMRAIVISQIVFIILGSFTIAFRWFTLVAHVDFIQTPATTAPVAEDFALQFYTTKMRAMKTSLFIFCRALCNILLVLICVILLLILGVVPLFLSAVVCATVEKKFPSLCQIIKGVSISSWKEEFRSVVFRHLDELPGWIMVVCVKDMNKWMSDAGKRFFSRSYMAEILSRPRPSSECTLLDQIQDIGRRHSNEYKVTSLSVVLLVKITVVSVPLYLSESLRKALDEAFEVFYFIDERINVGNFEDRRRREVAKLLWNAGDLKVKKKDLAEHSTSVEDVLSTFDVVCYTAPEKLMITELQIIREFVVQDREYTSIEELCDTIYQLFADMSRWFLKQFPASILKEVHESAVEEYEERATFVLKLLYKLDSSLEDKVQWLFPDNGSTITAFFDTCENRNEGIPSDAAGGDAADTIA